MDQEIQAVFEKGLFRPLQPIKLNESEEVTIRVTSTIPRASAETEAEEDTEPVWRGVFDTNRKRELLFKTSLNVAINDLPPRPFAVEVDWRRVTENE